MKKILVVDNSIFFVNLLSKLLRDEGHEVRTAMDGLAALDVLQAFRPDVIFTDMVMPRIGGDRLCRIIRHTPGLEDVFLVVLSAVAVEQNPDFTQFGADACIAKGPYKNIKQHIHTVLDYLDGDRASDLSESIIGVEEVYRREITQELLATKNHFEITLANISEGFLELSDDHRIIYVNDAATVIFGKSEEDLLATPLADHFRNEQRLRVRELLDRLDDAELIIGEEIPLLCNNRQLLLHVLPVTDEAERSAIVIIHDITQRKRSEQELSRHQAVLEELIHESTAELILTNAALRDQIARREQSERESRRASEDWQRTFEAIGDIAAVLDKELRIVRINRAGCTAFGTTAEELAGKRCHEVFRCSPDRCCGCPATKALTVGTIHSAEVKLPHLGKIFHTSASPIRDENNEVTGVALFARDITDKLHLEQRLRQSHKMEAIGTLAGGIAHDFNNILTAIMGYGELALENAEKSSLLHQDLEAIHLAGERGVALVQQILSFSRQSEQKRQPLLLAPLIKETVKLIQATLPATIDIRTEITAPDATIDGNPTQIHQILMNLCTNSAQALREKGGALRISLATDGGACREGRAQPGGPYLRLTVADNGPGIPSEITHRIFEPFFTTKEPGKGTGLGLATAHGIVLSHGGWITVDSREGEGAAFHVFLPLIAATAVTDRTPTAQAPRGSERILLVDDDEMILSMSQRLLEGLGYTVTGLADPAEALALFRSKPEGFDL
ncbi:MAG: PAS domain-containing protein, partial [Desulfobulbaceae bacterium]|nr:PAS domain-containing protein [Desulfobulbaceae bacterium]